MNSELMEKETKEEMTKTFKRIEREKDTQRETLTHRHKENT